MIYHTRLTHIKAALKWQGVQLPPRSRSSTQFQRIHLALSRRPGRRYFSVTIYIIYKYRIRIIGKQ